VKTGVQRCRNILKRMELLAKVFFCGSTSSPRTEKLNNFNLSPFTLSLSKGKLRTFARSSMDSGFRRNDERAQITTFYETILLVQYKSRSSRRHLCPCFRSQLHRQPFAELPSYHGRAIAHTHSHLFFELAPPLCRR